MGVNGLLKYLKPHLKEVRLSEFKGKAIGIDISIWIHKAVVLTYKTKNVQQGL